MFPLLLWWLTMSVFSGLQLSLENSDWGAFGSFVGGVLSPIFSVVSIIFIVTSMKASETNHEKTLHNLAVEQRRTNVFKLSESFRLGLSESTQDIKHGLRNDAWKFLNIDENVRKNL
jgi:uncharacterized membrane protein